MNIGKAISFAGWLTEEEFRQLYRSAEGDRTEIELSTGRRMELVDGVWRAKGDE